jgi:hypothetical protein
MIQDTKKQSTLGIIMKKKKPKKKEVER